MGTGEAPNREPTITLLADPTAERLPMVPLFRPESFHSGKVVSHVSWESGDALRTGPGWGEAPGRLLVQLAPDRRIELEGIGAMRGVHGDLSWMGRPAGDPFGLAVLTPTPTGMVGVVQAHGQRWEILHLGGGLVQVVELLDMPAAGEGCGVHAGGAGLDVPKAEATQLQPLEATSGVDLPGGPICDYDTNASQIDLLVVLTHGGRDEAGTTDMEELWSIMQNRVSWGNAALRSSGITGTARMVDLMVLDLGRVSPATMNDRLNVGQIIDCLYNPSQSHCPSSALFMNGIRDAVGADLVAVVTDQMEVYPEEAEDSACPSVFDGIDPDTLPDDDSDADTDPEPGCDNDDNVGNPHVGALACVECGTLGKAPYFAPPTYDGTCWSGPGSDGPWIVVAFEGGWNSMIHEIEHQLGADHGLWQDGVQASFIDNTAWLAPDCSFQTIMGAGGYAGTACEGESIDDIPFFSNSCVRAAWPGAPNLPQEMGDDLSENARIMGQAFLYVSAYRASVLPPPVLAQVVSPPDGVNVDATFLAGGGLPVSFNLASSDRFIEVGSMPGLDDIHAQFVPAGTSSIQISPWNQPPTTPFAIRLWTEVPGFLGTHWEYVDFRYNYAGEVVGRDFANGGDWLEGAVPRDFALRDCTTQVNAVDVPVCAYSGASTLSCDLGDAGIPPGVSPDAFWAEVATRRQGTDVFDYVVWGTAQRITGGILVADSIPFCCGFRESAAHPVHELMIDGTPQANSLRLHQCTAQDVYPVTPPLAVTVQGTEGDDVLIGSDAADPNYAEVLRGGAGDDRIYGRAGDDQVFGNEGHDNLFGGDGDDFIQGNSGEDQLIGGAGSDDLFGGDEADTLQGGLGFDELRGGADADLICDAVEGDDLRGQGGADRLSYLTPLMPTLGIADPPGPASDTCSLTPGLSVIWPTCETHVPWGDPVFANCPEWNP